LIAQQVTSTLTSLFINEHTRNQEEQSSNTTKFLHDQVVEKKAKLEQQEQRLREFKMQNIGELPEQQQGNLGILSGVQAQLQITMNALNHAQQERVYLQTLIEAHSRPASTPPVMINPAVPVPSNPNRPLTAVEAAQYELAQLQSQKAALLAKSYTPSHPD